MSPVHRFRPAAPTSATAPTPTEGWRSGELARLAGVSTDTLRHYERKGVLASPARLANGYRRYPAAALARVQLVRAALALGFTLDELADVLRERDRGRPPCRRVRDLAAHKLAGAEERLAELAALVEALRGLLASWDARLTDHAQPAPARLLESLVATRANGAARDGAATTTRRLPPPQPPRRPRRTR